MKYLQLARWPNVLMTVFTQAIILYSFLPQTGASLSLDLPQALLLIMATGLLTASGNVINDIYDVPVDIINKPHKVIVGKKITEKKAFNFYIILTCVAITAGFIVANAVGKPGLAGIFIAVSFGLYTYATSIKKKLLAGNLLISLLVGLVVVVTALFELFPAITDHNRSLQLAAFKHLLVFALFAFLINLLREVIKDCIDFEGDKATGRTSIPIVAGIAKTVKIASIYTFSLVIVTGYLTIEWLYQDRISVYYTVFFIIAPLLFVGLKLWSARTNKELIRLSLLCKLIMITGILGIALIKTNS